MLPVNSNCSYHPTPTTRNDGLRKQWLTRQWTAGFVSHPFPAHLLATVTAADVSHIVVAAETIRFCGPLRFDHPAIMRVAVVWVCVHFPFVCARGHVLTSRGRCIASWPTCLSRRSLLSTAAVDVVQDYYLDRTYVHERIYDCLHSSKEADKLRGISFICESERRVL